MTSYKIERKIIAGLPKKKLNAKNFVVSHETANDNATIDNEASYMSRNWQNAFVTHFVGGGGRVIQVAETGFVSWGAGPKANGYAFAQVELCRTKDKATFLKDYAVYCQLLADLAKKAGIPVTLDSGSKSSDKGIKSHAWITKNLGGTTHSDPYAYLAKWGISKAQFAKDLSSAAKSGTVSKPAKPAVKPSSPAKNLGLVDYMVSKKMDSSFSNRAKLAAKYGIKGYKGTASQNITLLAKLKGSSTKTPAKPSTSNTYKNKKLASKVNGLRFYNKPSWSDKDVVGTVTKGIGFPTIVSKVKVGTAYQYKVKNSKGATYYITASDKYVQLKNK
ncbi:N-acetylmuramoyl-L-alanine amidase [Listeria monocytogenes]|nr:N-acetylmuramoyl-L-alanine amidase [Listeria monocytogenes]EJZ7262606.1 N-acetylmuramoyl-L-alanine amidase [Listeria monocytogenes]EKA2123907.1 N-acetylmuramoyl-L-alanine amidase [Listeria monocytogenes]EKD4081787.1 N-acetylmuramoyl-L-alanine amidase [Listeria monocytogenes]EKD4098856.1 N-acetylmuramoyl-L-alanine amidase [Listeria monocytogenes]